MNKHPLSGPGVTQHFPGHCLPFSWCLALLISIFSSGILNAQAESAAKQKKTGTMVRVLCSQSLTGAEEEVILATKTKDGEWKEHGKMMLRSPFITPWVHVPQGITHLLSKQGGELVSLGSFKSGKKLNRIVLVLLPDIATKSYQVNVINPSKLNFKKGKALIINYSKTPVVVKLGGEQKTVKPGQLLVENITANRDNMYRLLVGYVNEKKRTVACYDRFVASNPETRKFLLLFTDPKTGIRVFSLSEFGPFE